VFLAGATGGIGTPLVPQLLKAGHEATATTRSVVHAARLASADAHPVVCDVFDAVGVRAAMPDASPEAVIRQLTALPPRIEWADPHVFDANSRLWTEGTRNLVDAALAAGGAPPPCRAGRAVQDRVSAPPRSSRTSCLRSAMR
jgi:nucleoside-diphosphate-sugar epimerase